MDAPFVMIFGLVIIVFVFYLFRNKRNLKLLTPAEKDLMSDAIAVANKNERWLLWVIIPLFAVAILLDTYFRVNNVGFWDLCWFGITAIFGLQVVFRNRRIHQKLNFPKSFVQSEFLFSFLIAVLLATLIFYSIWQDTK